ncbi:MAG TPA: OB-fold nucleic acid binding domain-containing protein, partial [Solirubrobacteraceae bacterium]|nr:OB-fold nucleic acid binding domain-containing protein [Solirubrobacteraceae bacterium]
MQPGDSTAVSVSALRPGQHVEGVFACSRKDRLFTRSGSPYLALELRDRSGTIQARAFQDADALAGRFERGELVRVSGRVERFRDQPVVEVVRIERVEPGGGGGAGAGGPGPDPADFL